MSPGLQTLGLLPSGRAGGDLSFLIRHDLGLCYDICSNKLTSNRSDFCKECMKKRMPGNQAFCNEMTELLRVIFPNIRKIEEMPENQRQPKLGTIFFLKEEAVGFAMRT